jgi:hypothetical protein
MGYWVLTIELRPFGRKTSDWFADAGDGNAIQGWTPIMEYIASYESTIEHMMPEAWFTNAQGMSSHVTRYPLICKQ